jgi:hydroxymethylpyrimidine/phosphomethylpyrimidine kinase
LKKSSKFSAPAIAMTIAGSDPSGGAGVQADLKSFAACGVHGVSVMTAVIAQNSFDVRRIAPVRASMVLAQIETICAEQMPHALKTGALINADIVSTVAAAIAAGTLPRPVIDPVLISSSGKRLLNQAGEASLRSELLPLAEIVTPNLPEAAVLSGTAIDRQSAMREAARYIHRLGARAVVIKGGHSLNDFNSSETKNDAHRYAVPRRDARAFPSEAIDLLFDGRRFIELTAPRISGGAHGTGCAFSAAIAAWLALGAELERAVREAKRFVTAALRHSYTLSPGGRPILGHLR